MIDIHRLQKNPRQCTVSWWHW